VGEEFHPRVGALVVSTSKAAGEGTDLSGPELERFVERIGGHLAVTEIVPDGRDAVATKLREWADSGEVDLILTSGGTGFSPDDQTPEATVGVADRTAPGIGEAMRLASREHTPHWMLSRATAAIRGTTLIVNFPGNPKAIGEAGSAIADSLPHALKLLVERPVSH
jgi:molybdenum cofactor synthesis domain-containing protein